MTHCPCGSDWNLDDCCGPIIGGGNTRVLVEGMPAAVVGDAATGHGSYAHAAPVMVLGSQRVFAAGRPVCRASDSASCGHVASGSTRVFAG